ncbi:phosphoglycerate kinase [Patescibacteria group bacterium]|nr:phosphoglycerate kinase [Patescibacteria group bacterium]
MNLKSVAEVPENSRVILRMDLDVPMEGGVVSDNSRLAKSLPTLKILLDKKCKVLIIGHRGRPEGNDPQLSLKPVYAELVGMLSEIHPATSVFVEDILATEKIDAAVDANDVVFLENLRFTKSEEENREAFGNYLASLGEVYVNDAFAVAHRAHASVMLHKKLPAFYGVSFIEETKKIEAVLVNPRRPLVVLLGGAKKDKLNYLPGLEKIADKVIVGGKLPQMIYELGFMKGELSDQKLLVAKLKADGLDLSAEDIANFKVYINYAKTIVWAGAMGYFESPENKKGTEEIAQAVAAAKAYKIVAGGDTGAAINALGLQDKIDFVCSGGGVMLEFITRGSLPAWE